MSISTFWIIAWILMGVAFLTATSAILLGALNLDKASERRWENQNNDFPESRL